MANLSIAELIAENLKDSMDGESVQFGSVTTSINCSRQRMRQKKNFGADGDEIYVEIGGPWIEGTTEDNRSTHCQLHFSVEAYLSAFNDESESSDPAAVVAGDLAARIIALIMADLTRGGYALITEWSNFGYFINLNEELISYVDVTCEAFISTDNPFTLGA
jgi:hypothetical protein